MDCISVRSVQRNGVRKLEKTDHVMVMWTVARIGAKINWNSFQAHRVMSVVVVVVG